MAAGGGDVDDADEGDVVDAGVHEGLPHTRHDCQRAEAIVQLTKAP